MSLMHLEIKKKNLNKRDKQISKKSLIIKKKSINLEKNNIKKVSHKYFLVSFEEERRHDSFVE